MIETQSTGLLASAPETHSDDSITGVSSIAYGFMASQALFAALDLGLFTQLAGGPIEGKKLAAKVDANPEPFRALLAACIALGLIERTGESYRNSPAAERYLVEHSRSYMGEYYLRQIAGTLYSQIAAARGILHGDMQGATYADFLDDPTRTEAFIRGQHAGSSGPAYLLAKTVDLSPFTCLLDLGGGSGSFAIEAVRRNATLRAVVVDHPSVIAVARKIIAEAGFTDRIDCVAGDVVVDSWPTGADLVLLSYVVSSYRPDSLRGILARAHAYLPQGGGLIIHDFALHGDRPGPRNAALWSFANLAISATTYPHTVSEIAGAMAESGYVDIVARPHIPDITFLFTGRRK